MWTMGRNATVVSGNRRHAERYQIQAIIIVVIIIICCCWIRRCNSLTFCTNIDATAMFCTGKNETKRERKCVEASKYKIHENCTQWTNKHKTTKTCKCLRITWIRIGLFGKRILAFCFVFFRARLCLRWRLPIWQKNRIQSNKTKTKTKNKLACKTVANSKHFGHLLLSRE